MSSTWAKPTLPQEAIQLGRVSMAVPTRSLYTDHLAKTAYAGAVK